MKNLFLSLVFLSLIFNHGTSQGFPNPCLALENAICDLGDLDGYELDMIPGTQYFESMLGCTPNNTWNNTSWIVFLAGSTDISIQLNVSDCHGSLYQNEGVQAGIYLLDIENCDSDIQPNEWVNILEPIDPIYNTLYCDCLEEGAIILTSDNFIVGRTYAIFVDGCDGSGCQIIIDTLQGGGTPVVDEILNDLSFDVELFDSDTLCMGASNVLLDVPDAYGASRYIWKINSVVNVTYESEYLAPGPFDTSFQVCVTAFNLCAISDEVCMDVLVSTPNLVIENDTICAGDSYSWDVGVDTTASGQYSSTRYSPLYNCFHEVVLNLTVLESNFENPTIIDTAICKGDVLEIYPYVFSESIDPPEIFIIPKDDSLGVVCDSFISLHLDVVGLSDWALVYGWYEDGLFNVYISYEPQPFDAIIEYNWYDHGILISNNDTLQVTDCGDYTLEITVKGAGIVCPIATVIVIIIDPLDYVGTPCDDGNPDTQNDVLQADCTCEGILVGVDDEPENLELSLEIFPNPFSNSTTITLDNLRSNLLGISIFNVHGKKVQEIDIVQNQMTYQLNNEGLDSGIYFCHVKLEDGALVERLVLLK